jgi:hypothetical protein
MANNPFDPQVVQIKRALKRGGLAGANQGFGSVRAPTTTSRPAPSVTQLQQLRDVDTTTAPTDGEGLSFDTASGKWVPAAPWKWRDVTPKTAEHTFALGDEGYLFTMGGNFDFVVPNDADEAFAIGTTIGFLLLGGFAGNITDAASVTLNGETTGAGSLAMVAHQIGTLTKIATDDWNVSGI